MKFTEEEAVALFEALVARGELNAEKGQKDAFVVEASGDGVSEFRYITHAGSEILISFWDGSEEIFASAVTMKPADRLLLPELLDAITDFKLEVLYKDFWA